MSDEPSLVAVERDLRSLGFDVASGSLVYLPQGRINDNFRLAMAGREAVLRIWKLATEASAAAELTLLRHLATEGIPCPHPTSFQPDQPLTVLGQPAAFFDVIAGGPHRPPSWEAHVEVSHEVARILARVHVVGAHLAHQPYRQLPHTARLTEYARIARELQFGEFEDRYLEVVDRTVALSEQVDALAVRHQLSDGVIHGDPGNWNVMVNGSVVHLLDFDMAHRDLLCYDVAQLVSQWGATQESSTNPARLWDSELARGLVDAYAEVRPLSEAERRAIGLCVPLRQALDVLGHLPSFLLPDAPFPLEDGLEHFAILDLASDPDWTDAFLS